MNTTTTTDAGAALRARLRALGLYALAGADDALLDRPWIPELLDIEEPERRRRSQVRRA